MLLFWYKNLTKGSSKDSTWAEKATTTFLYLVIIGAVTISIILQYGGKFQ